MESHRINPSSGLYIPEVIEAVEVGHLCGAIQADVAHDDVVSSDKGGALGWVHCYNAT